MSMLLFSDLEEALIGIVTQGQAVVGAVYDYDKIVHTSTRCGNGSRTRRTIWTVRALQGGIAGE